MPASVTNTVENQLHTLGFNSSLWVPEHEPYAHIITQNRFGFLALFGNDDVDPAAKFDQTTMKKVPGLISSTPSNSVKPQIDQYITYPTDFKSAALVSAFTAGTAKNVTLDSTAGLKAFDTLRDRATGSVKRVESVTSTTVVSCKSLAGGASGVGTEAIADNAEMELIGSAWVDGATFGDGLRSTPDTEYNYMQIMVDEYGIGKFQKDVKQYPDHKNSLDTNRTLTRINHNRKREMAALFGERGANTTVDSSETLYTAAGLLGFSSRTINVGGAVTLDEWNVEVMPNVTQYGGGNFNALCGSKVTGTWAGLAQGQIRNGPNEQKYGNRVRTIFSTNEEITLNPTEPMDKRDGEMLMFQPDMIERKYFPSFNSVHMPDIAARNTAKDVAGYATVECILPRNKDLIVLVTGVLA